MKKLDKNTYNLQNGLSRGILNVVVQNYLAFCSKQSNVLPLFDITEWQIPRARDLADRSRDNIASLSRY